MRVLENINTLIFQVFLCVELLVRSHACFKHDGDTACWMLDGRGHSL